MKLAGIKVLDLSGFRPDRQMTKNIAEQRP